MRHRSVRQQREGDNPGRGPDRKDAAALAGAGSPHFELQHPKPSHADLTLHPPYKRVALGCATVSEGSFGGGEHGAQSRHMKKLLFCFSCILPGAVALGQGVLLQGGQNYTFEFDTIPHVPQQAPSQVIAWFTPDSQVTGALLEIFPNSLSDNPVSAPTNVFIQEFPSYRIGIAYFWPDLGPNAQPPFFSDLQGVLRVTMHRGTAQLSGFEVSQTISGESYSGYFAVPEPAAATLVTTALGCLFFTGKFKAAHRR